jgi:DNA-binding HxlR family transcriptional regulator
MGLLDDLKQVQTVKGPKCSAATLLRELEPKESMAVLEALDNPDTSLLELSRVLAKNGHNISHKTLRRHRNRNGAGLDGCACL